MDANGQREMAKLAAEKILSQGEKLGWQISDQIKAEHLVSDLKSGNALSAESLVRELNGLRTSFHVALQTATFAYQRRMINILIMRSCLVMRYSQSLKRLAKT